MINTQKKKIFWNTAIYDVYSLILSIIVHEVGTIEAGNLIILHKSQLFTSKILRSLSVYETLTILDSSLEKDNAYMGPIISNIIITYKKLKF